MEKVTEKALIIYCLKHSCEKWGRRDRGVCGLVELCSLSLGFLAPLTDEQKRDLRRGLASEPYVCFD